MVGQGQIRVMFKPHVWVVASVIGGHAEAPIPNIEIRERVKASQLGLGLGTSGWGWSSLSNKRFLKAFSLEPRIILINHGISHIVLLQAAIDRP